MITVLPGHAQASADTVLGKASAVGPDRALAAELELELELEPDAAAAFRCSDSVRQWP